MLTDTHGRAYARFSTLKEGDLLEADDGFTCLATGSVVKVGRLDDGLCVRCLAGWHALDAQMDHIDGTDAIIGFYPRSAE